MRDAAELRAAFRILPEYLRDIDRGWEEVNFCDYGLQLTRAFRALKLWLSIQVFGLAAFRAAVARGIALAEAAEAHLRATPPWEVVTPAQLAVVTFGYAPPGRSADEVDRLNARLVDALFADGFAAVTSTVLRGQTVLRLSTITPRTTEADVRGTLDRLGALARREVGG